MNSPENWYYLQQGVSVGPLPRPAMEALIRAGTVAADTLVWPGYGEWIAAGTSPLAPLFTAPIGGVPAGASKWDPKRWLPEDKRLRIVILAIIVIAGLYAIYDGIQQIREGTGDFGRGSGGESSINFQGCRGVAFNVVECGYQNTGQVKRRLCMDVVVICADGRHVAAACSDRMDPGQFSTTQVRNFRPDIQQSMTCSGIEYENLKAKG